MRRKRDWFNAILGSVVVVSIAVGVAAAHQVGGPDAGVFGVFVTVAVFTGLMAAWDRVGSQ